MKYFGIVFMALLAPVAFANESLDSTAQRMLKMGKAVKSMSMKSMKSMKSSKSGSKKSSKTAAPTVEPSNAPSVEPLLLFFTIVNPPPSVDVEALIIATIVSKLSEVSRRLIDNDFLDTFFEDWRLEIVESVCEGTLPCLHVTFFGSELELFTEKVVENTLCPTYECQDIASCFIDEILWDFLTLLSIDGLTCEMYFDTGLFNCYDETAAPTPT